MKKRMTSVLALMMAMTMVFGSALTVHAEEDGCYHGDGGTSGDAGLDCNIDYSSSSDSGSYDTGSSNASSSAPSAASSAVVKKAAGSNTGVTGKEQFRALAKSSAGTYKVTHCGKEIATFHLMDADKNAVSCTAVALKQREDKKWAINYEVADATGLTVGAPVDRTYLYKTLGVSYVTINDTVVIDIEAEAAAADEAAKTAATAKAAK